MKRTFIINAKRLLAVLPLMLFALAASAQAGGGESAAERSTSVFAERLMGELSVGVGTKCNDVTPLEFSGKLGYRFIPRMYAFVHAGGLYGMYGKDSGQRYTKSANLGGGLGYTLFQDKGEALQLDVRGTVAASVGNADWKHVLYDAALVFRVGRGIKMDIGVGFRHVSSRTAGIGTYNGFYGTIGFGF